MGGRRNRGRTGTGPSGRSLSGVHAHCIRLSQSLHNLQHGCHNVFFFFDVFLGFYDLIQNGVVGCEHVGEQIRFLAVRRSHSVSVGTKGVGTKSHSVRSWHESGKHDLHAPQAKSSLEVKRQLHGSVG